MVAVVVVVLNPAELGCFTSGLLSPSPLPHPQSHPHRAPHITRAIGFHGFGELRRMAPSPYSILGGQRWLRPSMRWLQTIADAFSRCS